METKHTPGPWEICYNGETAVTSEDQCYGEAYWVGPSMFSSIVEVRHGAMDDEYGGKSAIKANARLIAASPELLKALAPLLDHYTHYAADAPEWKDGESVKCQINIGDLRRAHAVHAKATGSGQ